MSVTIVTGAGGFIGARVVEGLLGRGWRVHALGRGGNGRSWAARMLEALTDITGRPPAPALLRGLRCHDADLRQPGLGLTRAALEELTAERAVLIHAAADTRFNAPDPGAQRRINADACRAAIETLGRGLERAVHVSTAYVAGARTGTAWEDEGDVGQRFHNPYEASKLEGERLLREACEWRGIPWVITRPAIVINDSRTGRSPALTSLNLLVELAGRLWEHYGLKFRRDGQRADPHPARPGGAGQPDPGRSGDPGAARRSRRIRRRRAGPATSATPRRAPTARCFKGWPTRWGSATKPSCGS